MKRAHALFALCVLLAAPHARAAPLQGPLAAPTPASFEGFALPPSGGRLALEDGTRVLHLTGDERERGFAEGYLCAAEIRECFEEFALGHVVGGRAKAWDLVLLPAVRRRFEFPEHTRRWAEALLVGVRAASPDGVRLAALGRDLTADDVLACAAIPDLAGFLCSSFAAWGDTTASGDVFVGRNLDYASTPALERHSMVHVHAPLGERAGWVGVGWPGSPGCLTGLSARGVFVAIHDVDAPLPRGEGRVTPRVIALQELVEGLTPDAEIAAEALARLRAHRFVMGGNVLLAWQGRDDTPWRGAVVLELDGRMDVAGGVTPRAPEEGAAWVACSNHHRLRSDEGHGCGRYRTLARGAADGGLELARAWELIAAASMHNTLYRCVGDLGARALHVERHTPLGWQPRVTVPAPR